jgi:S1-C subfamily serine protease
LLASFEQTGPRAARAWGMALEPARVARRRRAEVGLSDQAGLLVSRVEAASPAQAAGIRVGDLITHRDSVEVRAAEDLAASRTGPVTLRLLRGDQPLDLTLHPDRPVSET